MTNMQAIWNSIRVLKMFDAVILQEMCSSANEKIPLRTVINYCQILVRAGYLAKTDKKAYRLLKNTGRLAITPCKKNGKVVEVYDRNTCDIIKLNPWTRKRELIEKKMKEKGTFTVFDVEKIVKTKASAKFYIHYFLKEGKLRKNRDLKGQQHKLVEYKYVGNAK